ncbi:MAG: oligosaccharide flippase family protein [Kiritimatiellales bacterium]
MEPNEQTATNVQKEAFFAREAVSGIPWMVASKAILFFVYFAISVLVVRLLGSTPYGIYAICMNIAEWAGVFCGLGLVAALFRFVPELVVQRNAAGLKRFLWKSLVLQGAATAFAVLLFVLLKPWLNRWFGIDFGHYLILTGLLIGFSLLKENVSAIETSLFRTKNISLLTLARGLLWLGLILTMLRTVPTVESAIWTQILSYALVYILGAWLMFRHIYSFNWRSPPYGIGKRRTAKYSAAILSNTVVRMMMMKYTEIFFLGLTVTPAVIGAYDLGYSLPPMVIFFIPDSLHMLFTSGFAEAYSRDPNCLGKLIKAYYKMTILFTVPLAVFGFFFAPAAVVLVYGEQMALAGVIASGFCVIHLFSTISTPLSMAIKAKERVMATMPVMILQIIINLILDWLLIVHFNFGVWGGMGAVAGTFLISAPIRLTVVRKIIGGIFFPTNYLLRMSLPLFALAGGMTLISNHWKLLAMFETRWINVVTLFALGALYMLLFLVCIRLFRLVKEEDVSDFRSLDIKKLNFIFDLLSPRGK